jgi:CheY-like chemotaxis protein
MSAQILVIDDESVTRRIVIHALRSLDVEVLAAQDGQEALYLAETSAAALAIVDINLPDMDGFEVMRHLRAMPHMQDTVMVVFTARNHPGDALAAQDAGAVDFLYKPFSTQELRDLVMKYLDGV